MAISNVTKVCAEFLEIVAMEVMIVTKIPGSLIMSIHAQLQKPIRINLLVNGQYTSPSGATYYVGPGNPFWIFHPDDIS